MIIYKTTNKINGKIYIGQDEHNDIKYLGSGFILKRAIKRYSKENFYKETLESCKTKEELNEREKFWIEFYDSTNKEIGYNIALGGQGGRIFTDEQKIEMGIFERISKAHKNKKQSDEHNTTIINGLNEYYKNSKSKKKAARIATYTEEEKKKRGIGIYKKNHTLLSDEGRQKIIDANLGKTPANAYWIIDIDTGVLYHGTGQLSLQFTNPNTARRAIINVCKGNREHFQNRKFKFKDS